MLPIQILVRRLKDFKTVQSVFSCEFSAFARKFEWPLLQGFAGAFLVHKELAKVLGLVLRYFRCHTRSSDAKNSAVEIVFDRAFEGRATIGAESVRGDME